MIERDCSSGVATRSSRVSGWPFFAPFQRWRAEATQILLRAQTLARAPAHSSTCVGHRAMAQGPARRPATGASLVALASWGDAQAVAKALDDAAPIDYGDGVRSRACAGALRSGRGALNVARCFATPFPGRSTRVRHSCARRKKGAPKSCACFWLAAPARRPRHRCDEQVAAWPGMAQHGVASQFGRPRLEMVLAEQRKPREAATMAATPRRTARRH